MKHQTGETFEPHSREHEHKLPKDERAKVINEVLRLRNVSSCAQPTCLLFPKPLNCRYKVLKVEFNEDGPPHIGPIFRRPEATEAAVVSEHLTSTGSQKTFQGSASLGPALLCPMPDVLAHPDPSPGSR